MGGLFSESQPLARPWPGLVLAAALLASGSGWAQDNAIEIPPGDIRAKIGDTEATISLRETECTGIELTADKPSLPFGDDGLVSWAFAPAGCKPPTIDNPVVSFTSAPDEIVSLGIDYRDSRTREPGDFSRLYYKGEAPGRGEILATFGPLSGKAQIDVADRPRCTGIQVSVSSATVTVGGLIEIRLPYIDRWGVDSGHDGAALMPDGCSLGRDTRPVVTLDPPDRAQLDRRDIRGVAPRPVGVTVVLDGLMATARFKVIAPPACDTLIYDVYPIAVGEVAGVAYHRNAYLNYSNSAAPSGQEKICAKPAGGPRFEAVNRHASVDRDTGVITGVSPGRARIGALHGDLIGISEFSVTDPTDPCVSLRLSYPPGLSFQERADPWATYEPTSCDPPPGLARFSVEPIGAITVSLDGSIFGSAPGKAKVAMRHGPLTAVSNDIEVAQLHPCKTVTGRLDPPEIVLLRPSTLSLTYEPEPCAIPKEEVRVVAAGDTLIYSRPDNTWGVESKTFWGAELGGDPGPEWDNYVFKIHVEHGPLSTNLAVPTGAWDFCRFGAVSVAPARIRPGETAQIEIQANRRDCMPSRRILQLDNQPEILSIEANGAGFAARAIQGGRVYLKGPIGPWVQLVVDSPPCLKLSLDYAPNLLRRGAAAFANVAYEPPGCTRPLGSPTFESSAATTVGLVRGYGVPIGTVRARDWNPDSYGNAKITMRHGDLTAEAVVGVVRE